MPHLKGQNEFFNQDTSKIITAKSFKLGMSRLPGEDIKEFFLVKYCVLQIWTLNTRNKDISKTITARSFKLGQLIK